MLALATLSPLTGASEKPKICTGVLGPALLMRSPSVSVMALILP